MKKALTEPRSIFGSKPHREARVPPVPSPRSQPTFPIMRFAPYAALLLALLFACCGSNTDGASKSPQVAEARSADNADRTASPPAGLEAIAGFLGGDLEKSPAGGRLPHEGGIANLGKMFQQAEISKAAGEHRKKAKELMSSDPGAAVDALVSMAEILADGGGLHAQILTFQVDALRAVIDRSPDAGRLLDLGKAQLQLGEFAEAHGALNQALEIGFADANRKVEALCWLGAADRLSGDDRAAVERTERASAVLAEARQHARAQGSALRRQQQAIDAQRAAYLQEVADHASRERERIEFQRTESMFSPGYNGGNRGSGSQQVRREYYSAKAAYEAEQARYQSELNLANSRAGRLGAQGIQINPRPVDQGVYMRYLNAKAAFERYGR